MGMATITPGVMNYLNGGSWQLVGEFTEVESGKHSDRPQLAAALAACKKHRAKLVIAKLDRLSRNLAFMDSRTRIKLYVHVLMKSPSDVLAWARSWARTGYV